MIPTQETIDRERVYKNFLEDRVHKVGVMKAYTHAQVAAALGI